MNLIEVFDSPFKLIQEDIDHNNDCMTLVYCTREIEDQTTKEEIYIISKMYFDNLFAKYKSYHINDEPATESSYKLYVDLLEGEEVVQKHIYSMSYDNIEDKINIENKYDDNSIIDGLFSIVIFINLYKFDFNPEEDYDYYREIRTTINEEECVICYENKPNILYSDCCHIAVCYECDTKGRFRSCPMCRRKIKNQKIRIT